MSSTRLAPIALALLALSCSSTPPAAVECTAGQTNCGGACVDLALDQGNCGACGTTCGGAQSCVASSCYANDCTGTDCSPSQVCPAGACVEKACIGVVCSAGTVCLQGTCVTSSCASSTCATGFACVNDACVDAACFGVNCPAQQACRLGMCVDASTCANATRDGTESDVDCGGACLAKCGDGQACGGGSDCASGRCVSGACVPAMPASCTDTVMNGSESDVDCGGSCPKCAQGQRCTAASDCASAACDLGSGRCSDTCGNGVKDSTEADVDCGGSCATRCANDQACTSADDCASRRCVSSVCTASSCTDLVKDGDETDVDCGGSCPTRCPVGQGCAVGPDCAEKVCDAGVCAAPTCTDGQKNGIESDLDCGRNCPMRCASGKACVVPNDCEVGQCTAGVCPTLVPSCMDGLWNQDEVDVDCGGTICTKCGTGKRCRTGADCLTTYCSKALTCVDGFGEQRMYGGAVWGVAAGDLNGDGVMDLVSAENAGLNTYLGQVDAGFLAPVPTAITVTGYSNPLIALADFSGDGRLDAVSVATNTGSNEVLYFRGSTTGWQAPTVLSAHPPGSNHREIVVADLDADGKLDIATAWGGAGVTPGGFTVLKGTGLGFTVAATVTISGRMPASISCGGIAAGDFDRDGKVDLAIGCEPAQLWVALNQGNNVFQLTSMVQTTTYDPLALLAYDFDGDNRLDIASGDFGGRVTMLMGNGDGTFGGPVSINIGGRTDQLIMRDMNQDGKTDLLAASSGYRILFGDGTGGFNVGPSYGLGFNTPAIAPGDFNGDGRVDICVVGLMNQTGLPNGIVCRYQQ